MKVVYGGLSSHFLIAGMCLTVAANETPSPQAEIMVFEEDTNLILTVDKEIHWQEQHPIRVMTAILRAKKHRPGSLVHNGKNWYAVVIDLDSDIVCQADWIAEAYGNMFTAIQQEKITTAAIHLLGTIYGKIGEKLAVRLLVDGLQAEFPQDLGEILVITLPNRVDAIRREIQMRAQLKT